MIGIPSMQLNYPPSGRILDSVLGGDTHVVGAVTTMTPSVTSHAHRSTEGSTTSDNGIDMHMPTADVESMSNGGSGLPSAGLAVNYWEQAGLVETDTHLENQDWMDVYISSMNNSADRGMTFHDAHYPTDWSLGDQIS